jgi:hypothetical protein
MYTYNGHKITVRGTEDLPEVAVFDARFPKNDALYKTTSLDLAMRWVNAYLAGEQWAVSEKLEPATA